MKNCLNRVFVVLALLVVMGHNAIAHHHHEENIISDFHDDHEKDNEHDHNLFSFGHLDEDFVPVGIQQLVPAGLYFLIPDGFSWEMNPPLVVLGSTRFQIRNEYPPPPHCIDSFSLRGPPSL